MNKRSLTLIMATAALVLCLLSPFAGAVTIGYTADSGGESVSISENYDVDNSVTVKETTDISFGNLQVDQERTAEGTGEADLEQTITGKTADGAQYTAENDIFIESEETINAKTYTSATGNTLGVNQAVAVTGDAELHLVGEEGANRAGQYAIVENGRVSSRQALVIGNSVCASLDASIWGDFCFAESWAGDADDNWANTYVVMVEGTLSTKQEADADGSATTCQESNVDAEWGVAASVAEDADGNWAATGVDMKKGELSTAQGAEADGSATADQVSDVDAKHGFADSWARDADGNWARTVVRMHKGELSTAQGAEADGCAIADQVSDVDAKWGVAKSVAVDVDGNNLARTVVRMHKGELSTVQGAEADGSATADQVSDMDAKWGVAKSVAVDVDGNNLARTVVRMHNGELSTMQGAEADGSATAGQVSDVDAKWGSAGSVARDADNNWAKTVVRMQKGELITIQGAEADGSATADQVSNVDAKWGYADTWARDADNNRAETVVEMEKGELITVQGAEADGSAAAGQVSDVDAKWGFAGSAAEDADNNWAETVVYMRKGELITVQGAEADGSAAAGQVSNVDAKWGFAGSVAEDADNNRAETVVEMEKGELITIQGAEADGSAIAVQGSYIEGDFAWAACEARNADGRVYVDNYVVGNAVLDFEGVALATDDNVIAGQLSYAEGDFINPWTIAENQYGYTFIENVVIDGTLYSASGAIANENVAFSAQYMYATGTYIYFSMEANNTHQGFQHTFSDEFWNAWVNAEAVEEVNEPGLWMVLGWESGPLGP